MTGSIKSCQAADQGFNMKIDGQWRGEYRYELEHQEIRVSSVGFTAQLKLAVLGRISGIIEDDPPGFPSACRIQGRVRGTHIFFRKIPEQFYTMSEAGLRSVAEYVEEAFGETVRGKPHAPHAHYNGELSKNGSRVEGVWHIPSYLLMLKGARRHLMFPETSGTWWMERAVDSPSHHG
jgi:hypothetical protein